MVTRWQLLEAARRYDNHGFEGHMIAEALREKADRTPVGTRDLGPSQIEHDGRAVIVEAPLHEFSSSRETPKMAVARKRRSRA